MDDPPNIRQSSERWPVIESEDKLRSKEMNTFKLYNITELEENLKGPSLLERKKKELLEKLLNEEATNSD